MTTSFPTGLDSFTNPTSTDNLDQEVGTRTHSEMHGDINDAVEALQAKVGVDSSAVTTSHDYKLGFIRIGTNTPEGAVTAPVGALFLRTNGGTGTTLYVKESGTGNTGWVAIAVSAGGYATIKDSGSSETQRTVLDFQDGFIVTDDGAETEVDIDFGTGATQVAAGNHTHTSTDRATVGGFYRVNLAASLTASQLERAGTALAIPWLATRAGSVTGLSVAMSEEWTAGQATFDVYKNGVAFAINVPINTTNRQYHYNVIAAGTHTFVAGDRLDVRVTTTAAWTPTTDDVECFIEVTYS